MVDFILDIQAIYKPIILSVNINLCFIACRYLPLSTCDGATVFCLSDIPSKVAFDAKNSSAFSFRIVSGLFQLKATCTQFQFLDLVG